MKIEIKKGVLLLDDAPIKRFFSESGDVYDNLTVTHAQIVNNRLEVNGIKMAKVRTIYGDLLSFSEIKTSPNVKQFHTGSGDNIGGDFVANKNVTQTHTGSGDNVGGSKFVVDIFGNNKVKIKI